LVGGKASNDSIIAKVIDKALKGLPVRAVRTKIIVIFVIAMLIGNEIKPFPALCGILVLSFTGD
jgi:hypothetical protein